jgi:outer membrane protein TolC
MDQSMVNNTPTFDLNANPSYQIMETQELLGEKSLVMQKWAYSPTLVGFYSYREKIMTTGFDLTPKNTAGLTLSIPILSGGTRNAQYSQKQIQLDKIRREKSLLEDQLMIQNSQLTFEYTSALENYLTQKENVEVAKRVYTSFNNKYKQGMVSSLELTQANSNYLQSENNSITAALDLLQAKLALNKLYNTL